MSSSPVTGLAGESSTPTTSIFWTTMIATIAIDLGKRSRVRRQPRRTQFSLFSPLAIPRGLRTLKWCDFLPPGPLSRERFLLASPSGEYEHEPNQIIQINGSSEPCARVPGSLRLDRRTGRYSGRRRKLGSGFLSLRAPRNGRQRRLQQPLGL